MKDERDRLTNIRKNLEKRALINEYTRDFFREQGFLEVETPVRMPEIAPEQYIIPVQSEGWFLSTSPELHMKRLLAAGYERLFQFSRCFRKGELGQFHNPEFTMLEWYRTGANYLQMLDDTEKLTVRVAEQLGLPEKLKYQGNDIDLRMPWRRVTVKEAFSEASGWDPVSGYDPKRFDIDLVDKVVPSFGGRATFLLEYPAAAASLSRLKKGSPGVAERGELFIAGLEIANAFSELRNPAEQEKRFKEEIIHIQKEQRRKAGMPLKFIEALHNLPECGGIALGVDRLVMLLCDAASIGKVMAFTDDSI
jgi:elongation factor P--(R)-beta-lysine ligase